ncbi:MAG: hypothetical protein JW994_03615 [Candidatus Omnitrophica bacterium]|nr:hypothetical protein [Candidatus Omnitrophota bacterium]
MTGTEKTKEKMLSRLLTWTLVGFLLRLAIMPVTMHGQDLTFINYFPYAFITEGAWNPYAFISMNFPNFPHTYYGPVLFAIMSAANFVFIKLFNCVTLGKLLAMSAGMMAKNSGTLDYIHAFSGLSLFKNLFLMKSPYLIFDFLIGGILLKLASGERKALSSYKLWIFNVVVLHSAYAVGQFDLIPTFFVILALLLATAKMPYLCIISLCLGGGTKVFPFILVLPAVLLLGNNWRKRAFLLFTALITTLFIYLPFYLSSGNALFDVFAQGRYYTGMTHIILSGVFFIFYIALSLNALADSKKDAPENQLFYYFLTLCFLVYAVTPIGFRYFVFATPFIALLIPANGKFGLFTFFIVLFLAFLRLPTRDVQLGLFAPLNPQYFMSIPTIQEVIGRFVDINMAYKLAARALLFSFFAAAGWVWKIKAKEAI